MVNPIYILIIALFTAFLLPVFDKLGRKFSLSIFFIALAAIFDITLQLAWQSYNGVLDANIFTAGSIPPFSINLRISGIETFLITTINFGTLLAAIYLLPKFNKEKIYAMMLFLTLNLGVNGLILTRDIFNVFVFLEITSISLYALIGIRQNRQTLESGFKYIIAGGLASAFLLLGIIFVYRLSGNLNIDMIAAANPLLVSKGGLTALFLIIVAFLIELKPWPANGWALDVYQAAHPGISAMVASIVATGFIFTFYKLIPLIPIYWYDILILMGMLTYVFSNLSGLKQKNAQRLLGYSSIAQMGLLTAVLLIISKHPVHGDLQYNLIYIAGALFINHFLAKAGLFWLAGIIKKDKISEWSLKGRPTLIIVFAFFAFALVGLPPFPGFWAKWLLINRLAEYHLTGWIIPIILGSLLEATYLLRWFGSSVKKESTEPVKIHLHKIIPTYIAAMALLIVYPSFADSLIYTRVIFQIPLIGLAIMALLHFLPSRVRGIIMIAVLVYFGWFIYPMAEGIVKIFEFIFIGGGIVISIASLNSKKYSQGYFEFLIMLILSLAFIPLAKTSLEFFLVWEYMTISSWLLVLRGNKGEKPALIYILFSLSAALMILTGFALSFAETGSIALQYLANLQIYAIPVYLLLAGGFLVKAAAVGLHIWLPGAYAEAEDEISPIFSGMMSKIGLWGFIMLLGFMGTRALGIFEISNLLGWIGVITAFFGALMAVFQEDIKYLLAYSSMSQLGYMILSVSLLSHLGWTTALYMSVTHLFFKGMLFLAIAGLVSRVGTTKMYEMGGLIKKMPMTFITVLIAIIAVSGVPPLSGFGGKWLLYTALLEKGWYLQAGLSFFAGAIAFLYLFRLIHTIFLGQLKAKYREVKEASLWYLVPQVIFIGAIMAVSTFPNLILKPIMAAVDTQFASTINWEGYKVITTLGYWNGNAVMMITMGVFMVPLIWLLVRVKMVQKVEQFNIVYAAERPDRPETTHFAYNFFSHYQKALGFLVNHQVTNFWKSVAEWFHSVSAMVRHIYTGNGQTYALHIIIYIVILYTLLGVN
ncbi:MAG: proton-conducting transporter membrane subunit [Candidatus Stygibacter australis]|nr:proton-conducting transporter membrane subunit [Candidatus Stygibacter australis]MDP8322386.1 proton-conducting transporter membrane subunit [Candidatus Stygibacter australis]